ncbi:hypothetical protein MA16_Dca008912 [Dendrobium catenatum]|uniref:Retrotransposon gag domain-containing protein n=1 Tax=Dendrobium catenatum TaxID=906689 RepID=A0A2I0WRM9_9ASPA|nr:hypothetical protein MA16_Dca008912 [Dendrobium catenatum]
MDRMSCPDERKESLATFILDKVAKRWWRGQHKDKLRDISNLLVNWKDFVELFKEWFVHISSRRQM